MEVEEIASDNKRSEKSRGSRSKNDTISIFKFKELFNCDFIEIVDVSKSPSKGKDYGYSGSEVDLPPEVHEDYDLLSTLGLGKTEQDSPNSQTAHTELYSDNLENYIIENTELINDSDSKIKEENKSTDVNEIIKMEHPDNLQENIVENTELNENVQITIINLDSTDFTTVKPEVTLTTKVIKEKNEQLTVEETPHYLILRPTSTTVTNVIREYDVPDATLNDPIILGNVESVKEDFTVEKNEIDILDTETNDKNKDTEEMDGTGQLKVCNITDIIQDTSSVRAKKRKSYILSKHNAKCYACEFCDYKSRIGKDVERHISRIHNTEYLKCSICPYETKFFARLKYHLKQHDKHQNEVLPLHSCTECDYQTTLMKCYKRHQKTVHGSVSENSIFSCKYCDFTTVYSFSMNTHVREKHQKLPNQVIKTTADKKYYQCPHCEYQTTLKRFLIKHAKIHKDLNEIVFFKCSHCPYQSNFKQNIKKHVKNVHKK